MCVDLCVWLCVVLDHVILFNRLRSCVFRVCVRVCVCSVVCVCLLL